MPDGIDVLTRLHGKGCRVASEIHHLLQGGYASALYARWQNQMIKYTMTGHGEGQSYLFEYLEIYFKIEK
ncbi:hypothetical protein [Sporomusa carbonis]|uniref:hypothetical protein n=1 Tax=Sporomusa carbonis TaxID=3076075 RepID=UPI003C7D8B75